MKSPLDPLIEQLTILPGVGPKSAQRMAFFLLQLPSSTIETLATTLTTTHQRIGHCDLCYNIATTPRCSLCVDPSRDATQICVVAEPKDVFALEKTHHYRGHYHVLGGLISPLDGIHADMLRLSELATRLQSGSYSELILALNPTIDGDATSLYITHFLKNFSITISKIAFGLPVGSDLEYADELTLQKALEGRQKAS